MNPGEIRADLIPATNGDVTFGNLHDVQPFANTLTVKTMTGAQIDALLEQQFDNPSAPDNRILQLSQGFSYTYDLARPRATGLTPSTIKLDGVTLGASTGYRVTMNNVPASGGDGFTVFDQGTDQLGGAVDIDAFEAFIAAAGSPVAPGPQNRITRAG